MFKHFLAKSLLFILILLQTSNFTYSSSNATGFSLKMMPRDSPESPIYFGNLTWDQKINKMVDITHARAHYLRLKTSVTQPQDGGQVPLSRDSIFYVTELTIGTPAMKVYLLMDTGSSLAWTQCLPCKNCYTQTSPLYNSQASTSYSKLSCNHYLCDGGPRSKFTCTNNECPYGVTYGGGASGPTNGVASMETIVLDTGTGSTRLIGGLVFGCSNDNVNFPRFVNTKISGIMGLSWAAESIVTQLDQISNQRFSYCLTPFNETHPAPSLLTFGDAIPAPKGNVQLARFVSHPSPKNHHFYLALLDISIGWRRLGLPPGMFDFYDEGKGGLVIDSGALFTVLNNVERYSRHVYIEVIALFANYYDGKGLKRKGGDPLFELCYEMPSDDFKDYLTITFHFDGSDYIVDGRFAHYFNRGLGYFCVTVLPGNGVSILGDWHQQNVRIVYDAKVGGVQYSPEICA